MADLQVPDSEFLLGGELTLFDPQPDFLSSFLFFSFLELTFVLTSSSSSRKPHQLRPRLSQSLHWGSRVVCLRLQALDRSLRRIRCHLLYFSR